MFQAQTDKITRYLKSKAINLTHSGPFLSVKPAYYPAAIEVSSSAIKLLQIAKIQKRYEIVKGDYLPLERGAHTFRQTLKESLEKLVKNNQLKGEVLTSVPLNKIQTQSYILPEMPLDEIESAILWKIKEAIPQDVDFSDVSFDYIYAGHAEDDNVKKDRHVLVFIVNKEVTMDIIDLFKGLSLEVIAIAPKPYAIAELLVLLKKLSREETVLVLQLGASQSSVTIMHSGYPCLIRPLTVSGNGFTETIAGYYQLDWEKAENLKREEGLGHWDEPLKETQNKNEPHCFPALSSQLESMVVDIEHTFKYFSHQLIKSKVTAFDRIVVCGGTSGLKNLDKFLMNRLGVAVDVFNPLDALNSLSKTKGLNTAVKEHSAEFAGALGLATRFIEDEIKTG